MAVQPNKTSNNGLLINSVPASNDECQVEVCIRLRLDNFTIIQISERDNGFRASFCTAFVYGCIATK